jgi:hypothetical protein
MSGALGLLGFVSVFEILGGIAIGTVLRRLIERQFSPRLVFFLIWGGIFAMGPFCMGASSFAAIHVGYLILVQATILIATIGVSAFVPEEYLSAFASLPVGFIAIGGILLLIGGGFLVARLRQDILTAAIVGAVFLLAGGVFLGAGLVTASKGR